MLSGTLVIATELDATDGGVKGELRAPTFGDAAPADLLVIAVAGALKRSFGVGAVMRTRVKLKTFIDLWKKKKKKESTFYCHAGSLLTLKKLCRC